MLERFALTAALHQLAQRGQFGLVELGFELEIKLQPRHFEHVRDHVLCVQARILDLVFGEIRRCRLQHFEQRFGLRHAMDDSFNRSATSATWSALIISSRSPSITRSRLYRVNPMRWSVRRFCGKL